MLTVQNNPSGLQLSIVTIDTRYLLALNELSRLDTFERLLVLNARYKHSLRYNERMHEIDLLSSNDIFRNWPRYNIWPSFQPETTP